MRACALPTASPGRLADWPYFVEYERPIIPWRMAVGTIDGETVIMIMRDDVEDATPFSVIRLDVVDGRIVRIADYIKCPWVLQAAASIAVMRKRNPCRHRERGAPQAAHRRRV